MLPSLAILIALSWIYLAFGDTPLVAGVFYGIKPAVTAIVLHAAWRIGSRSLSNAWLWAIAAAAFVAIFVLQLPFPAIVLAAGMLGWVGGRLRPEKFTARGVHGATASNDATALIADSAPPPPHARFWRRRLALAALAGLALWTAAMVALLVAAGGPGTLTQMAWFFTKAALLTFGGAYAVLPYVYQGAVEHFGWLSGEQMIAGLALGETTPGPLIMVVAFVGFVGGWQQQLFGADALLWAGTSAAIVVTFFTFLPSFVFIFAGAPLVESTHGDLRFTAPLTAITAAVVGVIASLALFFAYHVFWPRGGQNDFQWPAALIALAAGIALFRLRAGVIRIIAGCAAAGLVTLGLR